MISQKVLVDDINHIHDIQSSPKMSDSESIDGDGDGEDQSESTPRTISLDKPGTYQSMSQVAEGTWKVIYAPHMTTISNAFGGTFDVSYTLNLNVDHDHDHDHDHDRNNDGDNDNDDKVIGGITSHAKYNFPIVGTGYLSVAGTWGSADARAGRTDVCRVDFNQAWVKPLMNNSDYHGQGEDQNRGQSQGQRQGPYGALDEVPNGTVKNIINEVGKKMFIESVAVFPVSFLDDDLIVFDFELLGTRICAIKVV